MSRAYRVSWVTVSSTVTSSDTLSMKLSLLGILTEGEMAALLRDELARGGWTREDNQTMAGSVDGMCATLNAEGTEVSVHAEFEREIQARGTSQDDAMIHLDQTKKVEERAIQEKLTQKLSGAEPELRRKMGEVIQRVYLEALRRKAASMGAVESLQEGTSRDGDYEVTIKVRV
jgi:FtsH ternary system domain X5